MLYHCLYRRTSQSRRPPVYQMFGCSKWDIWNMDLVNLRLTVLCPPKILVQFGWRPSELAWVGKKQTTNAKNLLSQDSAIHYNNNNSANICIARLNKIPQVRSWLKQILFQFLAKWQQWQRVESQIGRKIVPNCCSSDCDSAKCSSCPSDSDCVEIWYAGGALWASKFELNLRTTGATSIASQLPPLLRYDGIECIVPFWCFKLPLKDFLLSACNVPFGPLVYIFMHGMKYTI